MACLSLLSLIGNQLAVAGISVTSKRIPLSSMKNPSAGAAQLKNISR